MNIDSCAGANPGPPADVPAPPIIAPPQIHLYRPKPRGRPAPERARHPSRGWTAGFLVLSAMLAVFVMAVVGLTGYFRLSSPTAALRSGAMSAVPGPWDKTIALRIGWFTTAVIRGGARLFDLPPEAREAIDALHGAEVGVYKLQHDPAPADFSALFASTDRAMKSRGWDRVVGVVSDRQFVAVYFPHRAVSLRGVKCCVVVFQDRDLVVASASGNLEPLLKLAERHIDKGEVRRFVAQGI